jgi:hypothetical protein
MLGKFVKSFFGKKEDTAVSPGEIAEAFKAGEEEVTEPVKPKPIKELMETIEQLERDNYDLTTANDLLRKKMKALNVTTGSTEVGVDSNTKEYYEGQISILAEEIESLKKQNCALVKDKSGLLTKHRDEMAKQHKEAEAAFVNLRNTHQKEVSKLSKQVADHILTIDKLKTKLKEKDTTTAKGDSVGGLIAKEQARVKAVRESGTKVNTGRPVFSDDDVREIRRRVNVAKEMASAVANDYKVSASTITRCAKGETYVNVK